MSGPNPDGMYPGSGPTQQGKAKQEAATLQEIFQQMVQGNKMQAHFAKVGKLMSFYSSKENEQRFLPNNTIAKVAIAA